MQSDSIDLTQAAASNRRLAMHPSQPPAFDPTAMRDRKGAYFAFCRRQARSLFLPDGTCREASTAIDPRIPYWLCTALVSSAEPAERSFANAVYAAGTMWEKWDVFTTSSIAANLARERSRMSPELIRRSEQHLERFVVRERGRLPCAGANDYLFHGYNDNMPAMCVRSMILAGEILGRRDYLDQGLFHLEGLCAHFERRGLLSEFTSGTYTPITLTSLMDVAELAKNSDAREMALACAHRILLDLIGHWHRPTGAIGGPQCRAYTVDLTETLSVMNALMWYLTGDPLTINPIEALNGADYDGPVHCSDVTGHGLACFAEVFSPTYDLLAKGVREFANAPRPYPYEIHATTDTGQCGLLGGVKEIQTRAWHQPLYALGTTSDTWADKAGHQLTLHVVLAATAKPQSWRDRVAIWHRTQEGKVDQGDLVPAHSGGLVEAYFVMDMGHYRALQRRGSAMVLGSVAPAMLDKETDSLKLSILFGTFLRLPDEAWENETRLRHWDGEARSPSWQFLRFGDVYVGIRATGMVLEKRMPARRVIKNKYLRLEIPLVEGTKVKVDQELREWTDYGYVFEIASRGECGSFEDFRRECLGCSWEFYHAFYRNSRYQGRHGELQIIDSVAAGTVRFMAIDGVTEPRMKFAATGLDPKLTQLFPDGRRITQRRIAYRPRYVGVPQYPSRTHILETDLPGEP